MSNRQDEGLTSFPVDSWEDTWDDSDAPVSQEVMSFCIIYQCIINYLIESRSGDIIHQSCMSRCCCAELARMGLVADVIHSVSAPCSL